MNYTIFIDESGDLGWKFDAPYGHGGSSRYLTITSVCVPSDKAHIPKRVIRELYNKFGWPTSTERKWVDMSAEARTAFAKAALKMRTQHDDIYFHAIVVKKENVENHTRNDCNKLYNYMIRISILDRMAEHEHVTLIPDPRSIKVKSGNSLHDYLQTELWFTKNVKTQIETRPMDSKNCKGIQLADMLAGIVQSKYEQNRNSDFDIIRPSLKLNCLFFDS